MLRFHGRSLREVGKRFVLSAKLNDIVPSRVIKWVTATAFFSAYSLRYQTIQFAPCRKAAEMIEANVKDLRAKTIHYLQQKPIAHRLLGLLYLARSKQPWLRRSKRLALFAKASQRLAYMGWADRLAKEFAVVSLGGREGYEPEQINWTRYGDETRALRDEVSLATSLILKAPGPNGELGVLYVSFEYNWLKLLNHKRSKEIFDRYLLVGASSWSPTDFSVLQAFQRNAPHPAFIGISNLADIDAYRAAGTGIRASPIMACDWVDPSQFTPQHSEDRDIDLLMVAHWSRFKRHDLLFEMLKKMPPHLHVVLVGRDTEGRTGETMRQLARDAGCKQELEIHTRIPNRDVNSLQARARAAIITSMREGSCVVVTESLAANTPVAMMRGAHVGSAAHINDQTGVFLEKANGHKALMSLIEAHESYSPRKWMIENCCAAVSSGRLNHEIRQYCESRKLPWTSDVAPLRWVYVPAYLHVQDRASLTSVARDLAAGYGVKLIEYPPTPGLVG
jgi:glycosyltransferase involved in cell wall biosynthesis